MNKKIAFVVVALVALVATFCVSFAGMPLAEPMVPDIGNSTGNLAIPESWIGGYLYVDLIVAQDYLYDFLNEGYKVTFLSHSFGIGIEYLTEGEWFDLGSYTSIEFVSFAQNTDDWFVTMVSVNSSYDVEFINYGIFRLTLPDDLELTLRVGNVDITSEFVSQGYIPLLGYFSSFVYPPSLGEIVIDNIIDTLWGTVVSVGDSFGEGMNQMVGDLFFDLETGDLSAFSIVIICFFALCLLVTIVNWLFFRLTNIKKF